MTLDDINRRTPVTCVIHGAAMGADTLGKEWAITNGIKHRPFQAKWMEIYGPNVVLRHSIRTGRPYNMLAGFERNQRMIDEGKPDFYVAFFLSGAKNAGTKDMVERCKKAGIKGIEI